MHNEITILLDEAHMLPKDLVNAFLTVFNTEKGSYKEFHHAEQIFPFDFTKQNFIFATTELDKLFDPFKDRLTIVDFRQYSVAELSEILDLVCGEIEFADGVAEKIAETTRGNARSAVKRAKQIMLYCESKNDKDFSKKIGSLFATLSESSLSACPTSRWRFFQFSRSAVPARCKCCPL